MNKRPLVNEHAASDVDKDDAALHGSKCSRIDQVLIFLAGSNTDDYKIGLRDCGIQLIGRIGSDIGRSILRVFMQARQALDEAVQKYSGKFILVVGGTIPTKDQGIYMKLAGRPALDMLDDISGKAAAIVAIGSCASWGGIPSADPDPTGAVGVADLLPKKSIVNIPGCPPNPYTLLGVRLQYAADGTLPEMDEKRRPKFAFDRDIHEHCPRRAHFDAGNFVKQYGDAGHREVRCLYEMGCKGPDTLAGCSTRHFNEIPDVWPIGIGAPCIGFTEKSVAFRVPMFEVVKLHTIAEPPTSYAPIDTTRGTMSPLATGLVGIGVGALVGAGYVASRKFSKVQDDESPPGSAPRVRGPSQDLARDRELLYERCAAPSPGLQSHDRTWRNSRECDAAGAGTSGKNRG